MRLVARSQISDSEAAPIGDCIHVVVGSHVSPHSGMCATHNPRGRCVRIRHGLARDVEEACGSTFNAEVTRPIVIRA